ncbi:MAG TPA: peptidylprolyl isomerase [Chitinophagaceae bacterium]
MKYLFFIFGIVLFLACNPKLSNGLRKNDLKKDIELVTTQGTIVLRLSDSTPLHRDNFLQLVKKKYYDSIIFHRVIRNFMIQAGDPNSRRAKPGEPLGSGGPGHTVPAEFRTTLFHKKGALAAARMGDDVNPQKASSGSQFYIVQGRIFSDAGLDSVETFRLKGRKLPTEHREIYKSTGGVPHLDQNYTVFGEVISGLQVVDSIASTTTSGNQGGNRPLSDIRIIRARLIKRN